MDEQTSAGLSPGRFVAAGLISASARHVSSQVHVLNRMLRCHTERPIMGRAAHASWGCRHERQMLWV
jgi:hypothetical protein